MTYSDELLDDVIFVVTTFLCLEETQVGPDSNFSTELGADSLDVVELVMALEEAFGVEIPDEVASEISTVSDAAHYIQSQIDINYRNRH